MSRRNSLSIEVLAISLIVLLALFTAACTKPATSGGKRMPANQEYSGFLKDYSKLAANPDLEGAVKTHVNTDAQKNLHKYVAVIVEPVEVYLVSDADDTKIPEKTRVAAANYCVHELIAGPARSPPPIYGNHVDG